MLEHFLDDINNKGLSAESAVHMAFFIPAAGFRSNKTAQVEEALLKLRKLGVVFVI